MTRRDFGAGSSFRSSSGSIYREEGDDDPRVGLVNLADLMLVFACGLMLSLVSLLNLDVSALAEIVQSDNTVEVEDVEVLESEGGGDTFVDKGRVYMDVETGKYYMVDDSGATVELSENGEGDEPVSGEEESAKADAS